MKYPIILAAGLLVAAPAFGQDTRTTSRRGFTVEAPRLHFSVEAPRPPVATDTKTPEERVADCQSAVLTAKTLKVLDALRLDGPAPEVVAGPEFFKMSFASKRAIIADVNCAEVGTKGGAIPFDVLHWRTGKRIGRFRAGRFQMD